MLSARFLISPLLASCLFLFGDQAWAQSSTRIAQASPQTSLAANTNNPHIQLHPDLAPRVRLQGHLPTWAVPGNPSVALAPETPLLLDLVLARGPAVEAAFQQRLLDQQDRTSPLYHQWLTPSQIGTLFGPNQADIDQVTAWLTSQGFQVEQIAPSRMFIRASAPAATAASTFSTSFRTYTLANGKSYRAAVAEPAIPAAFSGFIVAIGGLSEAADEPDSQMREMTEPASTGPVATPQYTSSSTGSHYITPGDFAILYDVAPVYNAGIIGTGQKVAIIGRSQVNPADITNYEASVGLPSKLPNTIIPPLGTDPGLNSTDQGEATLDVQRVLGTAPGVQADLVIASSASGGLRTAISYNVQTLLDPVMTISFGSCEANAGQANVNLYTQLFAQAAAEGISVFVSAGDSGAAGCDTHGAAPPSTTQIASINYICSSGFATCVGGTEFNDSANPAAYWSSTNSASRVSALGPIPEGVWNEPTSSNLTPPYVITAGGGGVSTFTPKPSFQTGTGVPADGFRDTPDVSFSSSAHDGYFGCYAQTNGGGSCVVNPTTGSFGYEYFSGTSAAAPSMAALAAMLNQKLGAPQGNLNPLIYRLASSSAAAFHDATIATSGVSNCTASVPSLCNNSTPSPTALTGGLAGYLLTPGYDLATGWGSLDVNQFFTAASATGTASSTTLTGTAGNTAITQQLVFTATVSSTSNTAAPTGTVQFFANGAALGTAVPLTTTAGVTAARYTAANTLALGTYLITAAYSGNTSFDPSSSTALTLTITPGGTTASSIVFTASPTTLPNTQVTTLSYTVTGSGASTVTPTGTVAVLLYTGGTGSTVSTGTLSGGTGSVRFSFSAGTYVLGATYAGDTIYLPSTSSTVTVVSTPAQSATALSGSTSVVAGATDTLTATVTGLSPFTTTVPVAFYDGTTLLGSATLTKAAQAVVGSATFTTAALSTGTHSFTATYAGDVNATGSTSPALQVTVGPPPGVTITPTSATLNFAAGAGTGNADVLTFTSVGGFTGPVTLSCAIAYNGTSTQTAPPACSFSAATVTVAAGMTAMSTLTVSTTATHSSNLTQPFDRSRLGRRMAIVAFALLFVCLPTIRRRHRFSQRLTVLSFVAASLMTLSGCGKSSSSAPTQVGTATGAYTVTVSATGSGGVSSQANIAMTVQ